jgi:hypothetical protein
MAAAYEFNEPNRFLLILTRLMAFPKSLEMGVGILSSFRQRSSLKIELCNSRSPQGLLLC